MNHEIQQLEQLNLRIKAALDEREKMLNDLQKLVDELKREFGKIL